jgi:hypothetical protein
MTGEWSGGSQNRTWHRTGRRSGPVKGDAERGERLYAQLAGTAFWCETCGGNHALCEHRACRAGSRQAPVTEARQ